MLSIYILLDLCVIELQVTRDKLLEAIQGHVLEEAELTAVFQGVVSN